MSLFSDDDLGNEFQNNRDENELFRYDPTLPDLMRTLNRVEIPELDFCEYIAGSRHPSLKEIRSLTGHPESGAMILPATISLLNVDREYPLSRVPIYGLDLIFQSLDRSKHVIVLGPTGAGKNVSVIDPLRYSAISDPTQTVVTFSLKSSDFGPIKAICDMVGKPMIVVNLNDAWRSIGWNPLATNNPDVALDRIRRFSDSVKNPLSNDSEFWTQWIKTALSGAWQAGYRSLPAIYQLFCLPANDLITELRSHANSSSQQLAGFLAGGSHNSESVLASIVGAMAYFLSDNVMRTMSKNELNLDEIFHRPVCLHIEMPETSLETHRVLYQMLARVITDELINNAEMNPGASAPATIFYDDMPSLGRILTPERMLTMRSRKIGIVAGVQTLSSLELAYGQESRALIDNFNCKIALPGGPIDDANYFSKTSGEQTVAMPTCEGQNHNFIQRPLLSSSMIRSPNYSHPLLGMPATIQFGAMTFQAYLQRVYELPKIAPIMRATRDISGRERLRKSRLPLPKSRKMQRKPKASTEISDIKGWSDKKINDRLLSVEQTIGIEKTTGSALKWWRDFVVDNKHRLGLVLRVAEELAIRKATITEFFMVYVYSNTDNIQGNLHYLDYTRLKNEEEAKKRQAAKAALVTPVISGELKKGIAIMLTSFGSHKLDVVKIVLQLTKLPLMAAKQLVESAPTLLGKCETMSDAEDAVRKLIEAGGEAHLEVDS